MGLLFCALISASGQMATNMATEGTADDTDRSLSLADAKQIALERNWSLLAAKSGVDSATAQLMVAKEFPNPTASLSTAKIGRSQAGTDLGDGVWERSYDSIAAVSQLIEIAGKRRDRQAAARAGVFSAKARFYDAKRTLDQGVTKAYIAALLAGENVKNLTESAGFMRHEANIAEAQHAAGDLSEADLNTIEINAEQFELQAKGAEAAATQARIRVELLMGLNQPDGNWTAVDTLQRLVTTVPAPTPDTDESNTNGERPDVLASESDLRGAIANLKLQKAERIPDPTISIGVEHEPPGGGPDVNTLNIGITFPLPLWNLNGGNIKAAQASVDQSALALAQVRAQAQADLATAKSEYEEAHARWLRYRDQTVPESAKVRETFEYKYQKGAATMLDLLNAEQTDNTVRLAYAQAMNDTAAAAADLTAAQLVMSEQQANSENLK